MLQRWSNAITHVSKIGSLSNLKFVNDVCAGMRHSYAKVAVAAAPTIEERGISREPTNFLVDIKGPALAFLPVLAFEGGTRRNIPKFEAGTLIYVRVITANPGMNPELSCTDASGKAAKFGALKDGHVFECSTGLSRMFNMSITRSFREETVL